MGWRIFYGALIAIGALILVNASAISTILIGLSLLAIGAICLFVELIFG